MSQDLMMVGKQMNSRIKIIKRYQNRKLYDTQQSCYVTLDDIAKMIRANEEVMVIDNKSKNDITAATMTQIIFEAEKRAAQYAPLFTLREIIQFGNGSISNYLSKLGAFPLDYTQPAPIVDFPIDKKTEPSNTAAVRPSFDDVKLTLEERVATAANAASVTNSEFASELPDLPNSNKSLNN